MDGKLFDSYLESKTNISILSKKTLYDNAERLQFTFVYKKKVGYYENIAFKNVPIELRIL